MMAEDYNGLEKGSAADATTAMRINYNLYTNNSTLQQRVMQSMRTSSAQ